ncbi:hypothetical protein HBB16_14815, partial [Pseudonocardia sp. MCCB 268]|nr:hypothetical protein [Pseudonocardia cytotoxica]
VCFVPVTYCWVKRTTTSRIDSTSGARQIRSPMSRTPPASSPARRSRPSTPTASPPGWPRSPAWPRSRSRRSWPDTLTVAVTERTPVTLADTPTGPQLVDPSGRLPGPRRRLPGAPPPVRGRPDDPATLAAIAVLRALPPVSVTRCGLSLGAGSTTFELGLTDDRRVL